MSDLQTCGRQVHGGRPHKPGKGRSPPPLKEGPGAASPSSSFLLPRSIEAIRDARYSRQERMEVRPFIPKGLFRQLEELEFIFSFSE